MNRRSKLVEDDIGENPHDLGLSKDFIDSTTKSMIYKAK